MNKKTTPFEITGEALCGGHIKLTEEQARTIGFSDEMEDRRFENLSPYYPGKARALCVSYEWDGGFPNEVIKMVVYGDRVIDELRQVSNTTAEGRVSIKGKKVSAFTSSQLFRLPSGHLVDCAVIVARLT